MPRLLIVCLALLCGACVVNQRMVVTRVANYDAEGNLLGYTIHEALELPNVGRLMDDAIPGVRHFETGTNMDRKRAGWPPTKRW